MKEYESAVPTVSKMVVKLDNQMGHDSAVQKDVQRVELMDVSMAA
jgi:hypothetical protein